jgi:hypothetical protein
MSLGHLLRFELAHLSCVRLVGFGMNFDLIAQICTFVGASNGVYNLHCLIGEFFLPNSTSLHPILVYKLRSESFEVITVLHVDHLF